MSEDHIPFYDEFIYCFGAATQVLKCGPWRDLNKTTREIPPKVIFLIIPGNPGVVGFYRTFMQALYCGFKGKYPVWTVSHAGHCSPTPGMDMTDGTVQTEDAFGLNGQIKHKLSFIQKNIPADIKLVLIGHSIGCYVILEIMKQAPDLNVLKSILLFPTIERMAESPSGKVMTPILCSLRYIVYVPLYLLSFMPEVVKTTLVKFFLRGVESIDEASMSAALNLFRLECTVNSMYMGSEEMKTVVNRDNDTIKHNLRKLIFYYGANDSWCPVKYYEDIINDFPDGSIWLCNKGFRHAFVLDSSREVASIVKGMLAKVL
ncbi:lipid droplet-associated hydrolase [Gastrophryne carolinensis]